MEKNDRQGMWHCIFTITFLTVFMVIMTYLNNQGALYWPVPTGDLIIMVLATYRLIRLFTYDSVTDYIRDYFKKFQAGPGKTLWHLLDCPWCSGMWMAMTVVILYFTFAPISWFLLLTLAIAGSATFIQIVIWRVGKE